MTAMSHLDEQELLHLAVEASKRDDHGAAITYLKQAIDLSDSGASQSAGKGKLLYLLGAEYAQIGMMDRAQENMAKALATEPELHTARFQLGLLYLSCAKPAEALEALGPLSELGEASPFFHLKQGLEHLIHDQFEPCRASLLKGMALNSQSPDFNEALNADMQKLINALPSAEADTATSGHAEAGFLMSAYNRGQPN